MTERLSAGVVASAWLAATVSLVAANVWEAKPFHTWTDKELQKVLTDSPWAGKASVKYVQNKPNQQAIWETATVTWASSRVIRQALVREEFGATEKVSQEAATVMAQTPSFYMVTVRVANTTSSASRANQAEEMRGETYLVPRGKPPIPATHAEGEVVDLNATPRSTAPTPATGRGAGAPAFSAAPAQRGGGSGGGGGTGGGTAGGGQRGGGGTTGGQRGGTTGAGAAGRGQIGGQRGRGGAGQPQTTAALVTFRFPRDPITLADKEVEFVTKLCGGGGFGRGGVAPAGPASSGGVLFERAADAQRGGTQTGMPGGTGAGVRMGDPAPPCNYIVKKTFKLKDMVVKGELLL